MHVYEISADTLMHCYAVDESENGEAMHLFEPMQRAINSTQGPDYNTLEDANGRQKPN